MKLWHTVKEVPHSSIVGGGAMLLAENGECVGIVHLLNVAPERRKDFEAAVFAALHPAPVSTAPASPQGECVHCNPSARHRILGDPRERVSPPASEKPEEETGR